MITRNMLALLVSGLILANLAPKAYAGPIFSGPATISATNGSLVFDLLNGGDLGSLDLLPANAADFNIQVISTVWSFDPPPGESGLRTLGGRLALAGVDSGLTFSETIDMADETGNVIFSTNNGGSGPLPFSETLAQHLLDNGGRIYGNLIPDPGTTDEWDAYFATGATLTNYLFLEITVADTNVIPEPSAVMVWGAIGGAGLLLHRRWRRKKAA